MQKQRLLKDAMSGEEFESLLTVGDDGVLYMSVGLIDLEQEDEPGMVDHPMFFCPFCGTKVQTPEEVDAKGGGDRGAERSRVDRRLLAACRGGRRARQTGNAKIKTRALPANHSGATRVI